ncbi:dTDP-4-dehydrorhamnose 3,5-epimerase [Cupriavidus necator]|uniref:dTDP-4-dehydrorhamnose 3,5-epimerase n=1 Tax=Cupriavidus necator TaxID=106590 RepID=UPI003ED0D380
MNIEATPIEGVMVVTSQAFADHRGAFQRLYCDKELADVLGGRHVVQANHSRTAQVGAVRGMHYQLPPHAEMKLVRCLRGRVWDVAMDLREGSPTFLRWHAVELSAESGRMFVIPEGCAHGFQVLEPESELLYLHTAHYAPQAEGGVRHDDPQLGIEWPLPVADLSQRDRSHPLLTSDYSGIKL